MNPDELRKALTDAVPDAPDPAGWADAAASRSRRAGRRRALAGVGATAVVLAAAPLVWRAVVPPGVPAVPAASHPAPQPAPPASGTTPGAAPVAGDPCAALGRVGKPEDLVELPSGALGVYACQVDRETRVAFRGGAPVDTIEPAELLGMLRSAGTAQPTACTADLPMEYALVFTLSGRQVTVVAEAGGCGAAGGRYGVGRQLKAAFEAAVLREREASGAKPPAATVAPGCLAYSWLPAQRTGTTAASACYENRAAAPVEGWAEIARATASGATRAEPGAGDHERTIVAADGRGEVLHLRLGDRTLYWDDPEPAAGSTLTWAYRPSDAHWARIAAAIAAARDRGAAPALCPAGATAAPATSLAGVTAAALCVTEADGAVTEYVLNEKVIVALQAEAQPGAHPGPTCSPESSALAARSRIVLRLADGSVTALVKSCQGDYRSAALYWFPSPEWARHLDTLRPR